MASASQRVIFFDAGSVLLYTPRNRQSRIRTILHARGYTAEQVEHAITAADAQWNGSSSRNIWVDTWKVEYQAWYTYYDVVRATLPDAPLALTDELLALCHFMHHCELYSDVIPTLQHLTNQYRLGVISNAFPSMDWVFDRLDLRRYFQHITISAFAGVAKPDPAIYHAALQAMQCAPEKAFFIDNKPSNVQAARTLGMQGVPLLRHAAPGPDHLTTLLELPRYLILAGDTA